MQFADGWRDIASAPKNESVLIACTWQGNKAAWMRGEAVFENGEEWVWASGQAVSLTFNPPEVWMPMPQVLAVQ